MDVRGKRPPSFDLIMRAFYFRLQDGDGETKLPQKGWAWATEREWKSTADRPLTRSEFCSTFTRCVASKRRGCGVDQVDGSQSTIELHQCWRTFLFGLFLIKCVVARLGPHK